MTTSSGAIPVTPLLGVVVAILLITATVVVSLGGYTRWPGILGAGMRAAVQLLAVSLVISQIVRFPALVATFVAVMFGVAVRTAGRRITANRTWLLASLPIGAGVAPIAVLVLVSGAVPATALVTIPLVGQLIGGALTATALSGRRLLDELRQRHGEVEAALSLGLTDQEARIEIARPVAGTALVPALDQTRTVGTVTLPGAFVGMLLGGATPVQAGVVQLFVLISLLAVEAIAIQVTLVIVSRGLLHAETDTSAR